MLRLVLCTCSLWLLLALPAWAQRSREAAPVQSSLSAHLMRTSLGNGLDISYAWGPLGRQLSLGVELRQLRDPREQRIEPGFASPGRKYVVNKLHTLTLLNPLLGIEWDLMPSSALNLLNLRGGFRIGPAIGLLNPYYLEICRINANNTCTPELEAFDPEQHNQRNIYGRASFSETIIDPQVRVGLSTSAYGLLDFSGSAHAISALRLGLHLDAFADPPPIMVVGEQRQNRQVFVAVSAAFLFGMRW